MSETDEEEWTDGDEDDASAPDYDTPRGLTPREHFACAAMERLIEAACSGDFSGSDADIANVATNYANKLADTLAETQRE